MTGKIMKKKELTEKPLSTEDRLRELGREGSGGVMGSFYETGNCTKENTHILNACMCLHTKSTTIA